MKEPIKLVQLFAGWESYQESLVKAIRPLTKEQLQFQVAPNLRSIMVVAAHIISARVWWFHFVMHEGADELKSMVTWDDEGEPERTAGELVEGLELTWTMIQDGLARLTPADLDHQIEHRRPGSEVMRTYTRQWIIWHVIEHDLHHGGELSFALGAAGLEAIDL